MASVASQRKIETTIAVLAARWPAAFHVYERRRLPLKIGIRGEITEALGGENDPKAVAVALMVYCNSVGYLLAMKSGAPRIGLDGQPSGACTKNDENGAMERLRLMRERRAKAKAARAAKPRKTEAVAKPKRSGLADLRMAAHARRQSA
jgi:ProP effector